MLFGSNLCLIDNPYENADKYLHSLHSYEQHYPTYVPFIPIFPVEGILSWNSS